MFDNIYIFTYFDNIYLFSTFTNAKIKQKIKIKIFSPSCEIYCMADQIKGHNFFFFCYIQLVYMNYIWIMKREITRLL